MKLKTVVELSDDTSSLGQIFFTYTTPLDPWFHAQTAYLFSTLSSPVHIHHHSYRFRQRPTIVRFKQHPGTFRNFEHCPTAVGA